MSGPRAGIIKKKLECANMINMLNEADQTELMFVAAQTRAQIWRLPMAGD
jgi:hypothetical protein